jgi:hypothetical protein
MRGRWWRGPSRIPAREGASTTGSGQEATTRGGERVGVPLGDRPHARRWRQRGTSRSAAPYRSSGNGERGVARGGHTARRREGGPARTGCCGGVWVAGNSQKRRRRATVDEQGRTVGIR